MCLYKKKEINHHLQVAINAVNVDAMDFKAMVHTVENLLANMLGTTIII
jgi:hypothetical protein